MKWLSFLLLLQLACYFNSGNCGKTFNEKKWNQFYSEVLGRQTTLSETMRKAEMWLIRTYWDFQFPHPLLPNFEFVGGLHCKPAKPLPKEMEEFVQSSGENGIVVFTLGSMITNMTEERANTIASALAQIPQKVLWRYSGKKPDTLGPNTRLYDWIPQNDLLGHPKTKAFITHGGTNGIYEAIYHGIPMVGIPLFADQPDNIAHMKAKGTAVSLDFEKMSTRDLLNALKEVINNPSYKENVMWLSTIQHDQPMKPLDRAVFWIEFVMRHKGAKHLRSAAHNFTCSGSCGKVLVWPVEYSHWMNMKIILDELAMRGHEMLNEKKWDQFYSEVLGRPTTLLETMEKAEFWLFRSYWDFEYPCPLLSNVEFIGGHHCKPAKPLPEEIEEFVQSSGEHGIVVFTLGSMVTNMTEERANMIASALAEIPQKVLWRHDGKKPDTLGPNTRLYKWVPQNDLLGHPKTKAFITHGGTNGIYEAIYHGVPMVGLPLFAEQPDNINRVKAKGAAVRLDLETMSKTDLLNALKQVINNPSYKRNAMWLSTIQRDQPIKPLDRAVFWIEFVMRHKGAKYLRPAAHNLTWFQYHSLDVIGFLLACVAAAVFVITKCFLFCCRKFAETGMKRKRE
ncbi:hypothetical protein ABFV05_005057 [Capra hircus]